ncbi:MAG: Neelaredoxin [Candidatus Solincola sediminis]|uniref:Neelaredoxin n=1 Tax=Candidatus Solincola sediminis TaxID=1797199 RepID=A0A1F2WUE5_9ACTN|nr:MAG: Neelaredoxin [Candidatus Solincola sediminis]
MGFAEQFQTADWKSEKHVPVIQCPDQVNAGEMFEIKVEVGTEIAHPNTTEHHIQWIQVFYRPDDDKFTYDLGYFSFNSHGASAAGPNMGPAYTHPAVNAYCKIEKPGMIFAVEQCNIHGLWQSQKEIKVLGVQQAAPAAG